MLIRVKGICTMENGLCVQRIWKGGERACFVEGLKKMEHIQQGCKRLGVFGFDSEGQGGIYYQISWIGESGIEALVIGPNFFPNELLTVLSSPGVYILGVGIWQDICSLSADITSFKTIDLSVLVSDLPSSNHAQPGMASIVKDVTGVDIKHLKKSSLRYRGWEKEHLSDNKVLYAALDATAVFPALYKVLQHWRYRYHRGELLPGKPITWASILETVLGPLVNRCRIDGMKENVSRDPLLQTAGLLRSMHISEAHTGYRCKESSKTISICNWQDFS